MKCSSYQHLNSSRNEIDRTSVQFVQYYVCVKQMFFQLVGRIMLFNISSKETLDTRCIFRVDALGLVRCSENNVECHLLFINTSSLYFLCADSQVKRWVGGFPRLIVHMLHRITQTAVKVTKNLQNLWKKYLKKRSAMCCFHPHSQKVCCKDIKKYLSGVFQTSSCFPEQEALPLLLSTGWLQEQI